MTSLKVNQSIFREYDIRGQAERDLTDEVVTNIGRAFAEVLDARGLSGDIAVGHDCRLTAERLRDAFHKGLIESGRNVIDIGMVPTPILYFAPFHWDLAGAVIITGSHNPAPDNGFKLLAGKSALHGSDIRAMGKRVAEDDFSTSQTPGTIRKDDIVPAYLKHATSTLHFGKRRPKVVVDAGNGAGGPAAIALYESLGFDVVPLYCEMDGRFPNHHPDPTVEANLQDLIAAVRKEKAEVGIALDGDADRIGAVDGEGNILWGDQLMVLFGRAILKEKPGSVIVAEVKCSQALYDELEKAGGSPLMWKVGHSLIKAKMKEVGAELGGEMSGHIFFANRYLGFDDAIYAGARLLEILSHSETTLHELYESLPKLINTPEIRIECPDEKKFAAIERITQAMKKHPDVKSVVDVDGVRASFENGWGLLRASNTQPAVVMRCEASTRSELAKIQKVLESELAAATT